MISRLGLLICGAFRRTAPDPLVLAIVLTLVTAAATLTVPSAAQTLRENGPAGQPIVLSLLEVWISEDGLWKFLAFGMQMCLILVTGHALACTRPVRRLIDGLAVLPRSTASAGAIVGLTAAVAGLINWGLGLIVGALLAREVGRALHERGIRCHYPLICAAGYMGLLIWHGGLSGSAPLSMATLSGASKVMPSSWVAEQEAAGGTGITLDQTIGSPLNMIVSGGMLLGVPVVLALLAPRRPDDLQPITDFDASLDDGVEPASDGVRTLPDRLDNSLLVTLAIVIPLVAALTFYVYQRGVRTIDLNIINAAMLAAGLLLHGSPRRYMAAATEGARGCAGIMIQFPLYGGIMAMMSSSGLVDWVAGGMVALASDRAIPVLSMLSAGVVNLFVPSGGGQWGIQGPIALETGMQAGIEPGRMVMAVAYGDQLTNMLQPFWALPLLAITGVRARDIVGYTAIVMVVAGLWIAACLLVL